MPRCRLRGYLAVSLVAVWWWPAGPALADADGLFRQLAAKLTYTISQGKNEFRFVAAVIAVEPDVRVEWFTTSPVAAHGIRTVGRDALASSRAHCECYRHREWAFSGSETFLWVSREVIEDLRRAGETRFVFGEDGVRLPRPARLRLERRAEFAFGRDGGRAVVPALVAVTDDDTRLWIHDDPADPLLLAVDGAWESRLMAVRTRPADRIGRFIEVLGRRLHVLDRGEGEPVFILHGGPGMEFDYFLPYLEGLERHARLIYIDQPGHGLSERQPPGAPYTMRGAVEALDALRASLGLETVTLLGHSYGGFVSQLYATTYPDRVSRLVLVDTAVAYTWADEAARNLRAHGNAMQRNIPPGLSSDERLRIYFPLYYWPEDPQASTAFLDRVILSAEPWLQLTATPEFQRFDMRPYLSRIAAPTLVLVGERDLITTPTQARMLHAGLPDSRLHVFPETGHNPFVEEPEAFVEVVAEFLATTR